MALVILAEAAAVGGLAGILGVALGWGAATLTNGTALRALSNLPFVPENLFAIGPELVLGVVGLATLGALGGAVVPVWFAVRKPPGSML